MVRRIILTIAFAALLFQAFGQSQQGNPLFVRQFTTEDGLSNASVTSIIQDIQGFMWIGTEMGLNRYDGTIFRQFLLSRDQQETSSLTNISQLYLDREGSLWAASDVVSQYISTREKLSHHIFREDPLYGMPGHRINSICRDSNDRYWIGTHEGISILDRNKGFVENVSSRHYVTITAETINHLMQGQIPSNFISAAASLLDKPFQSDKELVYELNQLLADSLQETHRAELLKSCVREKDPNSPLDNSVRLVKVDNYGAVWIVYSQHGISRIDPETQKYRHYSHIVDPGLNPGDLINYISVADGMVWIASTQEGLKVMDVESGMVRSIDIDGVKYIYHLMKEGTDLWVSTNSGLFLFCTINETVQHVSFIEPGRRQWLKPIVKYTYRDNHDNLWIGTEHYGLLLAQSRKSFHSYDIHINSNITGNISNVVRAISHDARGGVWVGYSDGRVDIFDDKGMVGNPSRPPDSGLITQDIHAILRDADGNMLVGSYQGGIEVYDSNGILVRQYRTDNPEVFAIPGNDIRDMATDNNGNLLVAIQGKGFAKINRSTGRVSYTSSKYTDDNRQQPYLWIWSLLVDRHGILWLSGNMGLTRYDIETSSYQHFRFDDGGQSFSSIRSLEEDASGLLWLATDFGVLIFNPVNHTYIRINKDQGLSANLTAGITRDVKGNIWVSTMNGLNLFNTRSLGIDLATRLDTLDPGIFTSSINRFNKSDGLISNHFIYNSHNQNEEGWLYFGTSHGVVFFHPDSITLNHHKPPVFITGMSLFNKKVEIDDDSGIFSESISTQNQIMLRHNQNSLTFSFSALNFINSDENQYAYILEGFDKDWYHVGSGHDATYTNLRHGHYRFRVRAANNDGVWSDDEARLDIAIAPPFFLTNWAFFGYLVITLGLLFLLRYIIKIKVTARMEVKRMQEIDTLKSGFFTNVAHEIRTPLLLISGPLDNLLKKRENFDWKKDFFQVHLMQRNVQRLQHLVNQFLDFRRIDTGAYRLNIVGGNIITFVKEITRSFTSLARQKGISLTFHHEECDDFAWFDPEIIETVVTNLVSNAIKFTPENGQVKLELRGHHQSDKYQSSFYAKDFISIRVIDTGPGVAPGMREKIFERYLCIKSANNQSLKGSGIGLSIAKEMIELHKGKIKVTANDPEDYSKGSTFTVYFPHGESYYAGAVSHESPRASVLQREDGPETDVVPISGTTRQSEYTYLDNQDVPTLLIVEDDADTRLYLKQELVRYYRILEAESAEEGLEIARNHIPELVISDIILPGISGEEMCQTMKSEMQTDHIPIILLTARASANGKVSGLKCGADAYITKPFSIEELLIRIRNLVETRKRIIEKFSSDFARSPLNQIRKSSDDTFMQKVLDIIQDNISNPDLDVDFLTDKLGMSRAQLYRKFNSIIKQPVKEFVRTVRLKKAAEMLMHDDNNITGIAYTVGFSSPPYFTRCFKATYGVTPTEFIQNRGKCPGAGKD